MRRDVCKNCVNRNTETCSQCDKNWFDKFVPEERIKKYFNYTYNGVRGINGRMWGFDTTNPELIPTHAVFINRKPYCPYCGDIMYSIQDADTLAVTGHCCICKGAMAEIEYEKKKKALDEKYAKELDNLSDEYRDRLTFCSEKLLEIKQEEEKKSFDFFNHSYNHFYRVNGKKITDIEQILH